ncbi:hypothetical protein [Streptomyces alkaliterrae]|uniref:Lipoprotein CseA n=1 Tax=Streptomyces alkaliterrae TaxID=2213162 RepID=A0A5P0YWQ0_9ACTN|nr:hypothetical protein [Streptomyces alkaliterrae]MBB1254277.1 hypothetical protein [Streptomyces alkaliterrae]MBB1261481.1 hypothetical protein [Streptomyces alkaliterrae]MQS04713.1 hypothetical protein [Streptomyces alkaliterrae]
MLLLTVAGCAGAEGVRVEQSAAADAVPDSRATPLPAAPATPEPSAESPDADPAPKTSSGRADGGGIDTDKPDAGRLYRPSAAPVRPPGAQRELDVIALLKADPAVDKEVKEYLYPCAGTAWPVDVAYGRLTGVSAADVVVNVSACADGTGVGSYVYRETPSGQYVNVFTEEEASVYAEVDRNSLRVYQDIYLGEDPMCCPTGQDVVTYVWRGGRFAELDRVYKDYPKPSASGRREGEG